jgi:hypothetical protein
LSRAIGFYLRGYSCHPYIMVLDVRNINNLSIDYF